MRKLFLIVPLAVLSLAVYVFAYDVDGEDLYVVTGGSVVYTNSAVDSRLTDTEYSLVNRAGSYAEQFLSISFELPVSCTNTFNLKIAKPWLEDGGTDTWVVTNDITDNSNLAVDSVTTNTMDAPDTVVWQTNTYYSVTTTNDTDLQVYDLDDLVKGLTVEPGDRVEFEFTGTTNTIYLRVGKEYFKR